MKRIFALLILAALLALPGVVGADGVCPCPENTVSVVKCEWNDITGVYDCTEGDEDAVTFGDGTNASGGTWTSTVEIIAVVVKGSTDCYTYNYDSAITEGDFSNEVLEPNPSGDPPDISSVEFCKPKPTAITLADFGARAGDAAAVPGGPFWLALLLAVFAVALGFVALAKRWPR